MSFCVFASKARPRLAVQMVDHEAPERSEFDPKKEHPADEVGLERAVRPHREAYLMKTDVEDDDGGDAEAQ